QIAISWLGGRSHFPLVSQPGAVAQRRNVAYNAASAANRSGEAVGRCGRFSVVFLVGLLAVSFCAVHSRCPRRAPPLHRPSGPGRERRWLGPPPAQAAIPPIPTSRLRGESGSTRRSGQSIRPI